MSAHFTVHCETCEIDGPDIRRQAGGTSLFEGWDAPEWSEPDERGERTWHPRWTAFLVEHAHHELVLRTGP